MQLFSWIGDYALPFLLVITVLVFVHEFGHYFLARRNGVKVEVFSIGFGPELWGRTDRAGTRWRIAAIPLGGYIRMFGDEDATSRPGADISSMSPEERAVSFFYKKVSQRMAIVFAGPAANFIFAVLLFAGLFMTVGQPFSPAVVGEVVAESAAAEAGVKAGDRIVRIDNREIERFEDIQKIVQDSAGIPLQITILRDGAEISLPATPKVREETNRLNETRRIGILGISRSGQEYVRHGPGSALVYAVEQVFRIAGDTLKALYQIIIGQRSSDELGGPLRIAQISGEVSQYGLVSILSLMAILSVNLGLINLFPVPLLDGGHLLYFFAEALRGKPLGEKAQEYGFRFGLAFIAGLMLFATWNDLSQLGFFRFVAGMFG